MKLRQRSKLDPKVKTMKKNLRNTDLGLDQEPPQESRRVRTLSNKTISNGRTDTHCWICHKPAVERTCTRCPRSFHTDCTKSVPFQGSACWECKRVSLEGSDLSSVPYLQLKEMMQFALVNTLTDSKSLLGKIFRNIQLAEKEKLFNFIDGGILKKKLDDNMYKRPVELLSDFEWIVHNCAVLGKDSLKKTAITVRNKLQLELLFLEDCPDCYYYRKSQNVGADIPCTPCKKPHDVVYAKVKGYYWCLAKLIGCSKNGSARVMFLGEKEMISKISAGNWFSTSSQVEPKDKIQRDLYISYRKVNSRLRSLGAPELTESTTNIIIENITTCNVTACSFEDIGRNMDTDSNQCIETKVNLNTIMDINQNEQQANNCEIQSSSPVVCEEDTSSTSLNEAASSPDLEIIEVITSKEIRTKRRKTHHSFSSDGSLDFGYKPSIGRNSNIMYTLCTTAEKCVDLQIKEYTEPLKKKIQEMDKRIRTMEKKVENGDKYTAGFDVAFEMKKEDNSLMSTSSTEDDIIFADDLTVNQS